MGSNSSQSPGNGLLMLLIEGLVILLVLGLVLFVVITVNGRPVQTIAVDSSTQQPPSSPAGAGAQAVHVKPLPPGPTSTAYHSTLVPTSDIKSLLTPTSQPDAVLGFAPFPPDVDPLTGLKVEDPSRLERRPIIVKVSNFPRTGRPHAGLSFADIVFEYYIGYDLNRFAAVFLGKDCPQVGPIRSGRLVDAQLNELYQSVFVYGDADAQIDPVIVGEIGWRALAEKYLPSPPKIRIGPIDTVTNLFVNTAQVTDYVNQEHKASDNRRDLRGMVFGDLYNPNSKLGTEVGIQYGTITRGEWHYDADQGSYLGWIEDPQGNNDLHMIPWLDRLNQQQLSFSNIVILFATYKEFAPTKHDIALYNNHNGKKAVFFRDGLMTEGQWRTPDNGHPIQFFNKWGAPYQFKTGNTWIVIAGDSSQFVEANQGDWEMHFALP